MASIKYYDSARGEWVVVSGGADPSAQSDWNQNDETKVDYVKNRTHYVIKTHELSYSGPYTWTDVTSTSPGGHEEGMKKWTSFSFSDEIFDGSTSPTLVDISGLFGQTLVEVPMKTIMSLSGINFYWEAYPSVTGYCEVYLYSSNESVFYGQTPTLSNFKTIKKLPEAYIPNTIARTSDLQTHVADKNNPHGVTAQSVGAISKDSSLYNLLDNSDFRNPVNQRGQASYKGAVEGIDKWSISSVAWMVSVEDGYIKVSDNPDSTSTATGMFRQYVAVDASIKGKPVTLAAKTKGKDVRLNINNTDIGLYSTEQAASDWIVRTVTGVIPTDADTFFVALQSRNATEYLCEWVALYEGEYTTETLPEYQPKGYNVELLNCGGVTAEYVGAIPDGGDGDYFLNGHLSFEASASELSLSSDGIRATVYYQEGFEAPGYRPIITIATSDTDGSNTNAFTTIAPGITHVGYNEYSDNTDIRAGRIEFYDQEGTIKIGITGDAQEIYDPDADSYVMGFADGDDNPIIVRGVNWPTQPNDATNKEYVDDRVDAIKNFFGSSLPDGYVQVEYIESSGTQYVDTGVTVKSNLVSQLKFHTTWNVEGVIYGCYPNSDQNDYRLFNANGVCYLDFPNSNRIFGGSMLFGVIHEIEVGNYYVKNLATGATIVSGSPVSFSEQSNTMKVWLYEGSDRQYGRGKLYYLKIYEGETLVRDFVPCKSASGEVGLYDKVSAQFYGNAGTGEFIAGAEVVTPISISIEKGGTGATTAEEALANLGAASKQYVDSKIQYGTTDVTAGSASPYSEGTLYVVIEAPALITFTINGSTYQAEEGMTWETWCANTTYNTASYAVSGTMVHNGAYVWVMLNGASKPVASSDAIIANGKYSASWQSSGGSSD